MTKTDLFKNLKLDKEEQKLEEALARGEFVRVSDFAKSKKLFEQAAKNYKELQKSKRITIRINQADLLRVKAKAQRSGIPYQTLLSVLIHQYAEGTTKVEL